MTEPLEPFLDPVLVSANLHVYVSQTDRGELVIGSEIDPYMSSINRSTLAFLTLSARYRGAVPFVQEVRVLRQSAGIGDLTPDNGPIIGEAPDDRLKAGPIAGKRVAELIATRKVPPLIQPFGLERFDDTSL